jgi:[citrate (pro-3S)-lyase] ligase
MNGYGYSVESIEIERSSERKPVEDFLHRLDLSYDSDVTHTVVIRDGGTILATGSLAGNILKCIGVDPSFRGDALTNTIVTELEMEAYRRGVDHLFLFSRPKNLAFFEGLGFTKVGEFPGEVVLMEKPGGGLTAWAQSCLSGAGQDGLLVEEPPPSTALVVNCNPFTLGHRYLVEQASTAARGAGELVHLFVVSEDRSLFPEKVRRRLVEEGTRDMDNVRVHPGGPYIISNATFPTYFVRDEGEATRIHAGLDVHIFGSRIAPLFGIRRRMVGQEPYCPVTAAYNEAMKNILPSYGVQVEEIPRLEKGGKAVSASTVRELIRQDRLDEVRPLVPDTTWNYLISEESAPVREQIRRESRRH